MTRITDSVTYVGKVDWELTKFHGEEYSTYKGSSYNSYLIRDKKPPSLIPYGNRMTRNSSANWKRWLTWTR